MHLTNQLMNASGWTSLRFSPVGPLLRRSREVNQKMAAEGLSINRPNKINSLSLIHQIRSE